MKLCKGGLRVSAAQGCLFAASLLLSFVAGLSAPYPALASVSLSGFGVTPSGPGISPSSTTGSPATPPARWDESQYVTPDTNSDTVGATPATYRVDESGAATYSVPLYMAPGTAGLTPSLSLEYNNRGSNGPIGPGWSLGGLSAISRCKKATEFGDGSGAFPGINFDGVAADQAYCLDGARLLDLNAGAGGCPAGQSGDTAHEFGLELDPATRVCGYTKASNYVGYVYWLALPKDGSYRVYGTGGNSALLHNANGTADTANFQYMSWGLNRIADRTGNTIELSYTQSTSTGELDISEIEYTGKIALSDVLKAAPTFTRSPYASVVFSYATLPAASQRVDYVAGMKLALTQQLTTITVTGPQNHTTTSGSPTTPQTVRVYHLRYGTPTSSSLSALSSLQECVPNGSGEVCYPRTNFQWNFLRGSTPGYPSAPSTSTYSGLQYAVDYKVGDVDGDGRQDLVWVKDQSCDSTGSGNTRFQIMVSLANSTGFKTALATGVYLNRSGTIPACGQDLSSEHFDTLWYLYDFSGDGRDDLLASNVNATTWKIFPSISVSGGYAFDGAHPVDTGVFTNSTDDGIFLDLNADGLPDLIHANSSGFNSANLLTKQSSGTLTFNFDSTAYTVNPTRPPGVTDFALGFSQRRGRNVLNADLNGDGAADLVLKVIKQSGDCTPQAVQGTPAQPGGVTSQGASIHFMPSSGAQPDVACLSYWYTYRLTGFTTGASPTVNFAYETLIGQVGTSGLSSDGSFIYLADLNGDGQADLVYGKPTGGNFAYYYRLNGGKAGDGDATERFLPEQSTGLTLSSTIAERVQLLDVNGDHRPDFVYQDTTSDSSGTYPMKALLWGSSGASGFASAPVDIGNSTLNAQNPTTAATFFIDVDGNGGSDYVTVAGTSMKVYGYGPTFGGNDFITTIFNGLGVQTSMSYYPLAYTSGYTRLYDAPAQSWGRGSPVFDVFSAIWVVHQASSTMPVSGAPTQLSSVVYRYSGARVQAGGRGFLGFKTVQAENQQPTQDTSEYLVTTTEYRQDFPYVGRPDHTVVELESSLQSDPCNASPGDSCFTRPDPPCGSGGVRCNVANGQHSIESAESIGVGGQVLSDAADLYSTTPTFAPGTVQPVMPYLSSSDEQKFDVTTSGSLSHEITSTFTDDKYGNVTSSTIISSESSGTDETKATANIYGCTVSPPTKNCATLDTEQQRLGRLSVSTVTSSRPGQTAVTRRASFEYDSTTLLRIAEIQGPYDSTDEPNANVLKTLGLRTDLIRDADGNVTEQVQCSTYHFANRTACISLAGFQQRQYSTDLTKIQRYATWEYESLGRFELDKQVPYYDGSTAGDLAYASVTGVEIVGCSGSSLTDRSPSRATSGVNALTGSCTPFGVGRDAFGNPLDSLKANGDQYGYVYGAMGRAYFIEDVTTGQFNRVTYTWCQDVSNTDIPSGAPRANCPVGAVYRVATDSTASHTYAGQSVAPTTWAYYDALGREALSTKRIYQPDTPTPSKMHWSSIATSYDNTGRTKTASTPYFSVDPTATQGGASTRAGAVQTGATAPGTATTSYDAVDRSTNQTHPEESVNTPSSSSWSYSTLTSTSTNPRNYVTAQTKNARDEIVSITAPSSQSNALTVSYDRDAVGNVTAIRRTPSDGNSAGTEIKTALQYDRLGRKISMTDPDKETWTYGYNALGEQVSQTDAKGQTQSLYRDALGRLYQRTENRLSGSTYVSEPTSTWEYDTAIRSGGSAINGMLHVESNGVGGFSRTTSYNDYGRVASVTTNVDTYSYTESQTYDQFGRPFQHFDPSTTAGSTAGELTLYSADGYPIGTQEAADSVNGVIYNQVLQLSQRGQVVEEQFHENASLTTIRTYDNNTGRMLSVSTDNAVLQNWSYDYDKHSNLSYRWNQATGYNLKESFTYDNLDRVHTVTLAINGTNGSPLTVNYDQLGNLTSKVATTTTNWTYGTQEAGCSQKAGPHAATVMGTFKYCYDANGNQVSGNFGSGNTRTITYTGYDLPAQIQTTYPSVATESFAYAPDRTMWKRAENASAGGGGNDYIFCNGFDTTTNTCPNSGGGGSAATYYVNNVEARVNGSTTTTKRYIGNYLVITTVTGSSTSNYAYLFRDALGSIDVIANETAAVIQRQSFDSWGNRRDATPTGQWGLFSPATAAAFDTTSTYQGYTGHQQLDPVGLVHMKGRLYDPALARFIQADPMTEADPTQGLNRYSYVLNNPLSVTDPTGFLSFRQVLGIAVGVVAAVFGQWEITQGAWGWAFAASVAGGFLSSYVATGSLKAGLWGAFAGGLFFGIGAYFSQFQGVAGTGFLGSGFSSGAFAAEIAVHGAAGGIVNDLQGGNFGSGFFAAGATEALSPAIENIDNAPARVMTAVLVGGTISKASGGKFVNGAETAALQSIFMSVARTAAFDQQPDVGSGGGEKGVVSMPSKIAVGQSGFATPEDAAKAFGDEYYAQGVKEQSEYQTAIVKLGNNDYGYMLPGAGPQGATIVDPTPLFNAIKQAGYTIVAWDHTHWDNTMTFSGSDMYFVKDTKGTLFLTNANGNSFELNYSMLRSASLGTMGANPIGSYINSTKNIQGKPIP